MRAAILLLWLCACDRRASETNTSPSASAQAALHAQLDGPAAFDIALTGDGAALVWSRGNDLLVQALDAEGKSRGEPVAIQRQARAREVAAVGHEGRLAVAWLHVSGERVEVRATIGTKQRFDAPVSLGPSEAVRLDRRGHVAVSVANEGKLVAFHRGPKEPCEHGKPEACASFGMHELPARGGDPPTRPRLAVPTPCDGGIVGVVLAGAHAHYGICALEGAQPSTTVFTRQPEPPYAQAQELLRGCTPWGMTALDPTDVWLVGTCAGKRSGVLLRGIEAASPMQDLSRAELRCKGDRPVLAPIDRVLAHPIAGLAPLLPSSIAPSGARAVWTGAALLVAYATGSELALARYRCVGGLLLEG